MSKPALDAALAIVRAWDSVGGKSAHWEHQLVAGDDVLQPSAAAAR